jgi:hypothetical protein
MQKSVIDFQGIVIANDRSAFPHPLSSQGISPFSPVSRLADGGGNPP